MKSREAIITDFKISLLFIRQFQTIGNNIQKIGDHDFMLLRLDTKPWNCRIKYSRKLKNLQYYDSLYIFFKQLCKKTLYTF